MDLKELLGEELFSKVTEKVEEHKIAVVSDGSWIPKEKFDSVNSEKNDYKKQLSDRDKQLEDLKGKAAGNEELTAEIERLKNENEQSRKEYENQLSKQTYDFALDRALIDAKAKNLKAVRALLNTEAISLDGDNLLGLTEQLEAVKESDPYLFAESEPAEPEQKQFGYTPGARQFGNSPKPKDTYQAGVKMYEQLKAKKRI